MKPEDEKIDISKPLTVDRTATPEEIKELREQRQNQFAEEYLKAHPEEGTPPTTEIVPF